MTEKSPKEAEMEDLQAAIDRLTAYLNEVDRVNNARGGKLMNWQHADEIHGLNDFPLRRSDIRMVVSALQSAHAELARQERDGLELANLQQEQWQRQADSEGWLGA